MKPILYPLATVDIAYEATKKASANRWHLKRCRGKMIQGQCYCCTGFCSIFATLAKNESLLLPYMEVKVPTHWGLWLRSYTVNLKWAHSNIFTKMDLVNEAYRPTQATPCPSAASVTQREAKARMATFGLCFYRSSTVGHSRVGQIWTVVNWGRFS